MSKCMVLAFSLLPIVTAHAQTPLTIRIDTANITIGMSRTEVADALRPAGLTPHTDDPSWWFLYNFQKQEIGALKFQNDRVVGALQNWVSLDASGVRTANGFIGAVAEALGKSGTGHCTVTVESHATPTINGRSVKLQCGKKQVIIGSSRSETGGESTIVIESVGDV